MARLKRLSVSDKRTVRDKYLRRVYGITVDQYETLLKSQGGGCGVCGKTHKEEGKALAVDHRHSGDFKGEITGVLCSFCNHRLIGRHKDPVLLYKMADYLGNHTGWFVPEKKKKRKKRVKK